MSKRDGWNKPAPSDYALPTETWREHVARRQRYEEVHAKLAAGEVTSINDLITYNLDIEKFAQDVIAGSEGPELIRAFWKALTGVSILDPTCGSGAFLFAALNILEPIYTACLEAMQGFLDDLERSKCKHHPEKMRDLRQVLKRVEEHASERYFILKSIIIDNLYGVDIMEEAVEICKLRLFLKLVAQLERYEQIEPLPDVDFNIRAGNTLVGFTSLDEVRRAIRGDLFKELSLPGIEERAERADQAFRMFRKMQTEHGMDARKFAGAKLKLRRQLDKLRDKLDRYLAVEYGVKDSDTAAYEQWRASHQPFHWFVEFYGIMHNGGFDVIIGNPPYVEYKNIKKNYEVHGFKTLACSDLYAYVLERSHYLSHKGGRLGMIVPISIMSTDGFHDLRNLLISSSRSQLFLSFSERPSKLFTGVEKRLCISLVGNMSKDPQLHLSNYRRWYSQERSTLLHTSKYIDFNFTKRTRTQDMMRGHCIIPKIRSKEELKIIEILSKQKPLRSYFERHTEFPIVYTRKARYFVQFFDFVPEMQDGSGKQLVPTELKLLYLNSSDRRDAILAVLNSSLFFWFFSAYSDVRNLNRREIDLFPCSLEKMHRYNVSRLASLGRELTIDFRVHSKFIKNNYKKYGIRTIQTFQPRQSKPIIDRTDRVLADHYGFTEEELDFIINYDIKYRMGLVETSSENDV